MLTTNAAAPDCATTSTIASHTATSSTATPDATALTAAMAAAHVFRQLTLAQQQEQLGRFVGICALYGYTGFFRLQAAHAIVIGTGGVGSWAAEALCRTGVGTISLVDFDTIELSNSNRQLHTLSSTLGKSKVQTLGARLRDINPYLDLRTYELKLTKDDLVSQLATILGVDQATLQATQNVDLQTLPTPAALAKLKIAQQEQAQAQAAASLHEAASAPIAANTLAAQPMAPMAPTEVALDVTSENGNEETPAGMTSAQPTMLSLSPHLYVVDAIDDLFAKARCLDLLHRAQIPVVTSGGAGGRIDPTRVRIADIAQSQGDQLIKRLRTELRRNYGYPQGNDNNSSARTVSSKVKSQGSVPALNAQATPRARVKANAGNFNILCTYSDEPPRPTIKIAPPDLISEQLAATLPTLPALPALPSFGAAVNVTANSGLLLASVIIRWIVGQTNANANVQD